MEYEFVKTCYNESPLYSSTVNLWKHTSNNNYYISRDFREIKKPTTDLRYTLLYESQPVETSPYRSFLTFNKQVSNIDFMSGFVEYGNTRWKL
jgi:hypothetical protein